MQTGKLEFGSERRSPNLRRVLPQTCKVGLLLDAVRGGVTEQPNNSTGDSVTFTNMGKAPSRLRTTAMLQKRRLKMPIARYLTDLDVSSLTVKLSKMLSMDMLSRMLSLSNEEWNPISLSSVYRSDCQAAIQWRLLQLKTEAEADTFWSNMTAGYHGLNLEWAMQQFHVRFGLGSKIGRLKNLQ